MQNGRSIAFFDLDGTITSKDTLFEFIRFTKGDLRFFSGMALHAPLLVGMKAGLVSNQRMKEMILGYFFKGSRERSFLEEGRKFVDQKFDDFIRPLAMECITNLREAGTELVIVSASAEAWVAPIASKLGMQYLSTRMEVVAQCITGKIEGKNCYGEEKVRRIREAFSLEDYHRIYAFGDSKGDSQMLGLTNTSYYRPFVSSNPLAAG